MICNMGYAIRDMLYDIQYTIRRYGDTRVSVDPFMYSDKRAMVDPVMYSDTLYALDAQSLTHSCKSNMAHVPHSHVF